MTTVIASTPASQSQKPRHQPSPIPSPSRWQLAYDAVMLLLIIIDLYQAQQLQYCPLSSRQGFNGIHLFSKVTPSLTGGIYNSFVTLETTI